MNRVLPLLLLALLGDPVLAKAERPGTKVGDQWQFASTVELVGLQLSPR